MALLNKPAGQPDKSDFRYLCIKIGVTIQFIVHKKEIIVTNLYPKQVCTFWVHV